jgi:hypothetical protein
MVFSKKIDYNENCIWGRISVLCRRFPKKQSKNKKSNAVSEAIRHITGGNT